MKDVTNNVKILLIIQQFGLTSVKMRLLRPMWMWLCSKISQIEGQALYSLNYAVYYFSPPWNTVFDSESLIIERSWELLTIEAHSHDEQSENYLNVSVLSIL